jgi:hypothetical protein
MKKKVKKILNVGGDLEELVKEENELYKEQEFDQIPISISVILNVLEVIAMKEKSKHI